MNSRQMLELAAKKALTGVVQGNLPELAGSIGTYLTFRDKPYGLEITFDQFRSTALTNSATGAGVALLMGVLNGEFKTLGNKQGGKRRRNRRNKKQQSGK